MYESIDVSCDCNEDISCGHSVCTIVYLQNVYYSWI